jgi:hypothetical protein
MSFGPFSKHGCSKVVFGVGGEEVMQRHARESEVREKGGGWRDYGEYVEKGCA